MGSIHGSTDPKYKVLENTPYVWLFWDYFDGDISSFLENNTNIVIVSNRFLDDDIIINFSEYIKDYTLRGKLSMELLDFYIKFFLSAEHKCIHSIKDKVVNESTYNNFVNDSKKIIPGRFWTNFRLFLDEILSNAIYYSGHGEGIVNVNVCNTNAVRLDIVDRGGKLDIEYILKGLDKNDYPGCFGAESWRKILAGGQGLRLILNFTSFININIIPDRLSQVTGYFIPDISTKGFIIENRGDVINAN
jgi:hypothetical protein